MRPLSAALIVAAFAGLAVPAAAQFSDGYNFLKAVKERDASKAQALLREPGSTVVNLRDSDGNQALHLVTRNRDMFWIRFLAGNGADVNGKDREGNTPLILAANAGFSEGVRELIRLKAKVNISNGRGETPLIKAVQVRNPDAVAALLAAGANPDQPDSFAGLSARQYAEQDRRAGQILKLIEDNKAPKPAAEIGPR